MLGSAEKSTGQLWRGRGSWYGFQTLKSHQGERRHNRKGGRSYLNQQAGPRRPCTAWTPPLVLSGEAFILGHLLNIPMNEFKDRGLTTPGRLRTIADDMLPDQQNIADQPRDEDGPGKQKKAP